jgi:hypothetical protein
LREIAFFLIQLWLVAELPGRLISARLVVNPDFKPFQLFPGISGQLSFSGLAFNR